MIVGIDASRAFSFERTGIEEYSYQVIKHLTKHLNNCQVVLYVKKNQKSKIKNQNDNSKLKDRNADFILPGNWKVKIIKFPYLWTQLGLSLEMFSRPVDKLFIPAHTVPWIHPKNTIVTIHGLEYEILPEAYSFWGRLYMRISVRLSCFWAKKIIAVSHNTKKDLTQLYEVSEDKIEVIYNGINQKLNLKNQNDNVKLKINTKYKIPDTKYLLFVGRLEERKNTIGIIRAFEILKEKYKIPHKLVLAGKFGLGEEKIRREIKNINFSRDIILTGYVSEEEKWEFLKNAEVFIFPTLYEGFGLPVLEAQLVGTPVVASNNSSILEIAGVGRDAPSGHLYGSVVLVDPKNAEEIADAAYRLISDKKYRDDIIEKGYENVKRFSWNKCAGSIAKLLNG